MNTQVSSIRRAGRRAAAAAGCAGIAAALWAGPVGAAAAGPSDMQLALARSEISAMMSLALITYDNKDFSRFAAMFTPQGKFSVDDPAYKAVIGRADMTKEFNAHEIEPPGAVRHILTGLYVTLSDLTHARLRGYYMTVGRSAAGIPTPKDIGSYNSTLTKVNGRWLFENYHVIHAGPIPLN